MAGVFPLHASGGGFRRLLTAHYYYQYSRQSISNLTKASK
jgi:hypothetical protein